MLGALDNGDVVSTYRCIFGHRHKAPQPTRSSEIMCQSEPKLPALPTVLLVQCGADRVSQTGAAQNTQSQQRLGLRNRGQCSGLTPSPSSGNPEQRFRLACRPVQRLDFTLQHLK